MHKDATGKDLAIGDKVVYARSSYATLRIGYVIAFTPKNIRIGHIPEVNYGELKVSSQVAKVE